MNKWFRAFLLGLLFAPPLTAGAATIAKCQDADGHWHYGDFAAEVCAQSKVTRMNAQGVKVSEEAAPLTEEELAEQMRVKDEQAELQRLADELEAKRRRIVAIYDSEADIMRARDTHLTSVDQRMRTEESILSGLKGRNERLEADIALSEGKPGVDALLERKRSLDSQIRRFEAALANSIDERIKIISDYEEEVSVYRELTGVAP